LTSKKKFSEIIQSGKSKEYVSFILSKQHQKVGVGFAISPVNTNIKNTTQLVCVVRDITERLRDTEEITNLASFPNENPNPIFRIDVNGKILFSNNNAKTISNCYL